MLVQAPERHADDKDTLEALLPLTDVMGTGHHAPVSAGVRAGDTRLVVGDGAVVLCGLLAARRLGAERIIAVGHHEDRLEIVAEFGATETVAERGRKPSRPFWTSTYAGEITLSSASVLPQQWRLPSKSVGPEEKLGTSGSPTVWTMRD